MGEAPDKNAVKDNNFKTNSKNSKQGIKFGRRGDASSV
jgi:hypothetical protein